MFNKIAIDQEDNNRIHVMYSESNKYGASYICKYAVKNAGNWDTAVVDDSSSGLHGAIAIDSQHRPNLLFKDADYQLVHAVKEGQNFTKSTVSPDFVWSFDLARGNNGDNAIYIAYNSYVAGRELKLVSLKPTVTSVTLVTGLDPYTGENTLAADIVGPIYLFFKSGTTRYQAEINQGETKLYEIDDPCLENLSPGFDSLGNYHATSFDCLDLTYETSAP